MQRLGLAVMLAAPLLAAGDSPSVDATPATSYADIVLADGPVGYWRLGDTGTIAADVSTAGRHGTFGGNVTKAMAGALAAGDDGATGFDGGSAVVTVDDGAALRLNGAFSIEFWARQRSFANTWPGLLNKGASWTADGYLIWHDADGRVRFKRNGRSVLTPPGALTQAKFTHFVVTHDGSTTRWHVDGQLVASTAGSFPANMTTAPLRMGQGDQAGAVILDEVAIYDRALDSSAIADHHRIGTTPTASASPPGSPTSVTAVGGDTRAWVTWTPPTTSGSSALTAYTVTASPGGRSTTVAGTTTSAVVAGLTNGTRYDFTVIALNSAGAGPSSSRSPTVTVSDSPMVAAAGDIACAPDDPYFSGTNPALCQMAATADLIKRFAPAAVLPLGDTQYDDATLTELQHGYSKSWGTLAETMVVHPVAGNHEYGEYNGQPGKGVADGYFTYFGAAANPSGATTPEGQPAGWYSTDIGGWHLVALNTECGAVGGCSATSPQGKWLAADLAASNARCTVAVAHRPRWGDDAARDNGALGDVWSQFVDRGVELFVTGHKHAYQRFAKLDRTGAISPTGTRQIVAGTGGKSLGSSAWGPQRPIEEVRDYSRFGALLLTLHPASYDWYFVGLDGAVIDQGSNACHDATAPPPPVSYADAVAADSPVAWWRLGEPATSATATDASGRGLHGTYDPGVTRGIIGALATSTDTAIAFDGSDASMVVQDGAALRLNGSFTVEFWARQRSFVHRWPGILSKGESWTPNGYLIWYDADGRLRFKRDRRTVATPAAALTSQWNHYAVTFDGSTVRWYVGGRQVTAVAITFPANATDRPFRVGRGDEPGAAALDEVAVYDRALPASRIEAHVQAGR